MTWLLVVTVVAGYNLQPVVIAKYPSEESCKIGGSYFVKSWAQQQMVNFACVPVPKGVPDGS